MPLSNITCKPMKNPYDKNYTIGFLQNL